MFSFIRKFFETRRECAAECDRLCCELTRRLSRALSDFVDVDKDDKESVQKWLGDNGSLFAELNDISKYKRTSSYGLLKQQIKNFDDFWLRATGLIRVIQARERQKCEDAELVAKKLNQLVSEQKSQKVKAAKLKNLDQKMGKLTSQSTDLFPAENNCSCCGKDGKKKILYSTEGEAITVAEHRSKIIGIPLHIYPCPYGDGFLITSNQN